MMQAMVQRIQQRSATIQLQVATRFDKVYGKIQEQVCVDVQQRCGGDGLEEEVDGKQQEQQLGDSDNQQIFAWQEKLFCREYINECAATEG